MSLKTSVKLRLAGLASTAMLLSAGAALSADLVISNWAGYMAPDIAETFASIAAQLVLKNPKRPGVWAPEEYFTAVDFFPELEKRKFKVSRSVKVLQDT